MKKGATKFLKQVLAAMNSVKARLALLSMLRNKKLLMMASVSRKLNNLPGLDQKKKNSDHCDGEDKTKAIVLYRESGGGPGSNFKLWLHRQMQNEEEGEEYEDDFDVKFPDMTQSPMFDLGREEEDDGEGDVIGTASVIEMVKSSREESGEEFKLEDEIDHVADLYIQRFHWQLKMQKHSSSLKRIEWPQ